MASDPSPEVKSILKQTPDLTTALANEPVGVAGILLSKDLISSEVYFKVLLQTYMPMEKGAIMVDSTRKVIEITPEKFSEFVEILCMEQTSVCAKVVESLRSTYQSLREQAEKEVEVDTMIGQLEHHFSDLHEQTVTQLNNNGQISVRKVLSALTMLPIQMRKEFETAIEKKLKTLVEQRSIDELFLHLNPLFSFLDYGLLEYIVRKFCDDKLKQDMMSYSNKIHVFMKQTTVMHLIDYFPGQQVPPHYSKLKANIKESLFTFTLEQLNQLRRRYCCEARLSELVCVIIGVEESNSFSVTFLIPTDFIPNLILFTTQIDRSFFQKESISLISVDGRWLYDAEMKLLHDQFCSLHEQATDKLRQQDISVETLAQYLVAQTTEEESVLQMDASIQLSKNFLNPNTLYTFTDHKILKLIVENYGSDALREDVKFYCDNIDIQLKKITVERLMDYMYFKWLRKIKGVTIPPIIQDLLVQQEAPVRHMLNFLSIEQIAPSSFTTLELRIDEDVVPFTLDKLYILLEECCNDIGLSKLSFIAVKGEKVLKHNVAVVWYFPSFLLSILIESVGRIQTSFFKKIKMKIVSLSFGNRLLYNEKLSPFGSKLKEKYQQSQGTPSPVEWIPSPTKKIFRLAMIQRERVQQGHIEDRFVRMTISGRVDDILHAKSPVELEHIFRDTLHGGEIILIEGAPGSGKSTLTVHICQRWGKGELFQQFTVVILVQLRDPAVQRAQTIADLLPVENAEELAAEVIATNGRGVLWVLDGWDELPPHLQQYSIFCKLIKRMLKECSVIVTSRPISSGHLHPVVSSRIEVLGFTPEEQRQYFTECLKGDKRALKALLEKIQENPMAQSICYLPLNAAFIVHTFKYRGQSLPNTEYEIYSSVILSCIQRHYEREGRGHDLPRELASLDDLSRSEVVREPFQCLCELAYRGVMENKVTFSSSDLPQGSNTLSLLQAIESFLQSGKSVFYNFLHLSIQEILSAYYIATRLSGSEQVSQFKQLFNQPRFAAVFQFYAAITKLKSPGIRQVIDRIVEKRSKPLLVSLLRCLHEAQDLSLCCYVAEQLDRDVIAKMEYIKLDLSEYSLSPLDCLSVSFFLSSADVAIKVNLHKCSIGDLGAKSLAKYLDGSVDHVGKATILQVSRNDIHEEGASHIARTVNFIEHLDLSWNPIGDTGASLISEAMSKAATLKSLSLNSCHIIASNIAKIFYFIEHLYLSDNPIGDTGASLISEAVRETATLKTMILFGCGITSRGAKDLSRALAQNSSLTKLDISNNNVGDEGISYVAEALKQNKQLKELWICECGLMDEGAASLASALSVNNSLRMLHMGGWNNPALTVNGLSTITQSLVNNSEFVKLAIPIDSDFIADHLSHKVNEARKRNGLPPFKITAPSGRSHKGPSMY